MGNATVTPAVPVMSPTPFITTIPRTSVIVLNSDMVRVPTKSPAPSIPNNPPISNSVTNLDTAASPINSPIPSLSGSSINSTSPTNLDNTTVPTRSPAPPIPSNSLSSIIPVALTTDDISATPKIPVTSFSPSPSIDNIFVKYYNSTSVISPDTSAVSPTHYIPRTPIESPIPTVAANPRNSINSFTVFHSDVPITNNTAVSTVIPVKPTTNIISTTLLSTKVAPKRTASKTSLLPPIQTIEQTKSTNLSSFQRWDKLEQKQHEKHKGYFPVADEAQSLNTSIVLPKITTNNEKETSVISNIVATPSFSLRSTAVCNSAQDNYFLSEQTQSIHKDASIFKYYLTQKATTQSFGNHTKATMFKMNTLLKQTPLPTPSLSFLTKNFNDGTHETDDNSIITPTFGSLGLKNDLEIQPIGQYSTEFRLHEKEQQKSSQSSSLFPDLNSSINNSSQLVSSIVPTQSNLSSSEKTHDTRPPLVSILKKRAPHVINKPVSTQTDGKISQEFQKNDTENYSSTVSFNIPSSKKTSQSISRSIKLFSKRLSHQNQQTS